MNDQTIDGRKKPPIDVRVGTLHKTKQNGTLIVKEYINSSKVLVQFVNTGFTTYTVSGSIRRGNVKDPLNPVVKGVGFMGVGNYKPGGHKKAYYTWVNMLTRCYCADYQKRYPTYEGCSVVDEWCNFQRFAVWFYDNYPSDRSNYHLDKDMKVKGNKIYGPDTCLFVIADDNTLHSSAKHYKFRSPKGEVVEVYNLAFFCRENGLSNSIMCQVHAGKAKTHKGWGRL